MLQFPVPLAHGTLRRIAFDFSQNNPLLSEGWKCQVHPYYGTREEVSTL